MRWTKVRSTSSILLQRWLMFDNIIARTIDSILKSSITQPSISAGVGLVYKLDPVRVEVNFGVPLTASKGDGTRKGFQVGIGLDFL